MRNTILHNNLIDVCINNVNISFCDGDMVIVQDIYLTVIY